MHSEGVVISVKNVTKAYRLFDHPGDRIKQFLSFGLKRYHREFSALNHVSFDIRKGETVGIIGRNGSGKSTLLQLICGILTPTLGSVQVSGRISALLELGSGFNPEFTGRENIYFQGVLMGFTKAQMDQRFDDIAAFADIGEFIDQPVRMYSSGMFVRLAFAVAVSVDPDILVVDEALAVGDAAFQAKCLRRIDSIRKRGGTILIVTHAMEQVAHHCDRALLLDHGHLLADGDVVSTLQQYLEGSRSGQNVEKSSAERPMLAVEADDGFSSNPAYNPAETRWGDRQATIESIRIVQNGRDDPEVLVPAVATEVWLSVKFSADVECPIYGLVIKSMEGAMLLSTNSRELCGNASSCNQLAGDQLTVCFRFTPFLESGEYTLSVGVASQELHGVQPHDRRFDSIVLRFAIPRNVTGEIAMNPSFERRDTL